MSIFIVTRKSDGTEVTRYCAVEPVASLGNFETHDHTAQPEEDAPITAPAKSRLTKLEFIERLGDAEVLGGVFGRDQAVYVAISRDDAGGHFTQRISAAAARWGKDRPQVYRPAATTMTHSRPAPHPATPDRPEPTTALQNKGHVASNTHTSRTRFRNGLIPARRESQLQGDHGLKSLIPDQRINTADAAPM